MKFNTLDYEQIGAVGLLTLNRPTALNALNNKMFQELKIFCELVDSLSIRCLIITGAGEKAFAAGADIKEMMDESESFGFKMSQHGQNIFAMISKLPVPVIAAVNGYALGGGLELALSCDFIIASKTAVVGLPEVSLGLIPGYGGTQRLVRSVGEATARMMVLSGGNFSAEQAANWGIITELTEPEALVENAIKRAEQIASRSLSAMLLARKAINQGADWALDKGMELESELFQRAYESADKKEGVSAFIDKRKPNFN